MNTLILMAGDGTRLKSVSKDIKPLIKMPDGRRLFEHVLDTFDYSSYDVRFIMKRKHPEIKRFLNRHYPNHKAAVIGDSSTNPVETIWRLRAVINDEPLLIFYCSQTTKRGMKHLLRDIQLYDPDAALLTYGNMSSMGCFVKTQPGGIFYWKSGTDCINYAKELYKDASCLKDLYIRAHEDGKKVISCGINDIVRYDTPEDFNV